MVLQDGGYCIGRVDSCGVDVVIVMFMIPWSDLELLGYTNLMSLQQ